MTQYGIIELEGVWSAFIGLIRWWSKRSFVIME